MEIVGTAINAIVVGLVGLILAWLGKGRFEAQERRIDRLEERLEHRMDTIERGVDTLRASADALRSDLTQVALAVGVRPRATNA